MTSETAANRREGYPPGYGDSVQRFHSARRASDEAGFLVPHLRTGMRLLDVGSGPGSITLDLAEIVTPGEVIGIDIEPSQVERARAAATARGAANVQFQVANAYALPFPDASFDAVFAYAVLMHLQDPLEVLREFRRVLRPGGLVGIRDAAGDPTWEPSTELLSEFVVLHRRVAEHVRGRPLRVLSYQQRGLLRAAGFARTEGFVDASGFGTLEATRERGLLFASMLDTVLRPIILAQGWADAAKVDAMVAELRAWAERPDSFSCSIRHAAVGWVDAAEPEAGS
jgi:ubiquinone/menaquinone biosynthesis C-methylase UbiE